MMRTSSELSSEYFEWLCDKICVDIVHESHWILAKVLHSKHFYWTVPNDDNRGVDGMSLRDEFAEEYIYEDYSDIEGPCTMLEMLIALAKRCEYMMAKPEMDDTLKWFWLFLENLDLIKFNDENFVYYGGEIAVNEILDTVLDRSYEPDGNGGLFPLKNPKKDQRNVEIWYQLSAYLLENYY